MAEHPYKQIRKAINFAERAGWVVSKSDPRANALGTMKCGLGHSVF